MNTWEDLSVWKLLIVEDEEPLRDLLARQLESMSIEVIEAADAMDALKILGSQQIDAVLSDINMPGLSGLDFLAETRKRGSDVPFVFLTARNDRVLLMEALRLGALDFLDKPFEPHELEGVVLRALHWGVARRRNGKDNERLERLVRLWNHDRRKKAG